MAVKTPDTKDDQNQAYNPSQEYYDSEFNKITGVQQDTANDLRQQENQAGVEAGIDQAESYANDKANASKNIDKAKEREKDAGNWQTNLNKKPEKEKGKGKLSGWKRKGPLAGIGGAVVTIGIIAAQGLTLMPVTIAEMFTNDGNDAASASQEKFTHLFGKKANGSKLQKRLSICNSVVSFRCKMRTLPPNLVEEFEKENFKFHDKTVLKGNRIGFSALEFPDGSVANNINELKALLKDANKGSRFNFVFSLKNAIFLIGDHFKNALGFLGLNKGKKIDGDTKAEADKSFEEATKSEKGTASVSSVPGESDENATEEEKAKIKSANESGNSISAKINEAILKGEKLKSLSAVKSIDGGLAVPQLLCLSYNMTNFIAVTAKIKKAMYFAGFAMIFLTLASSIKANKATEAEVAKGMDVIAPSSYPAKVEDPETGQMIDNPNIGKNALDAEAYKVVAYGDKINLTGIAMRFFIAGGVLGVLQNVINWIDSNIGRPKIKVVCKAVTSKVAQVINFLAAPVLTVAFLGILAILPVEKWAAELVNAAIDAVAGANFTTGIKGVDAGNVLFIGAVMILGTSSRKFGLKPGKLAAIRKNMADNHELLQQEVAMKTYEASKTPLDITNRYSFLGSMAVQLASFVPSLQSPAISSVTKLLSAIPGSFAMLTKNANAAYSMPVADYSDVRFGQCKKDEVYNSMKQLFDPDMFCAIRYVPDPSIDDDAVFDYLENTGNIDKVTADPLPGSYTEKYIRYCVDRTDPWGSTSVAAEEQDDDVKWYTGENCFITPNMPKEDATRINMNSEYVGYRASENIIDSFPKIKDTPTPQQALFNQDTYSAMAQGMSLMMNGAQQ